MKRERDYAQLASDAYEDRPVGPRPPGRREPIRLGDVDYWVVEHVNNRTTGYQGTVYQRVDSGEIVVAHRGTEQIWKDGVVTDGAMVLSRINPQVDDAIELTRRALAIAKEQGRQPGKSTPGVTVTGHSLGGTLAQVTAHHFDLRGETFNAYGATSLDRRIPEGGNRVLNHVMAADTVSAASPHYGRVQIYATEREVATLRASGYQNNRLFDVVTPDNPLLAAGASLGSHSMHHFLPVDGKGARDRSVLDDPRASDLAEENRRAIAGYRNGVEDLRRGITVISRGPFGALRDGFDAARGPILPGEPAAREERAGQAQPLSEWGALAATAKSANERARAGREVGDESFPFHPPLRSDARSPSSEVERLLKSAQTSDPGALRAAQEELQASDFGQAWLARGHKRQDEIPRQLPAQDAVQREAITPSTPQMAR